MFSRRQTCRGRSQSPVVWIAEVMETETLKPIDKVSPGEATSHRAVTKVNPLWPRKRVGPTAERATQGRRQHGVRKSDRCGITTSAERRRQHGGKGTLSHWRNPSRSGPKSSE